MLEQELTSKIQYYTVDDDAFVNPEDKKCNRYLCTNKFQKLAM